MHPSGLAWRVEGGWKDAREGTAILKGDPVLPGSLVQPSSIDGPHSLTVLLPDGQRVSSECFTQEDCGRGFRIPPLTSSPSAFELQMLDRIRLTIAAARQDAAPRAASRAHATAPQLDEAVAVLGPASRAESASAAPRPVDVGGLLAILPSGSYTYDLQSVDRPTLGRLHLPLQKVATTCTFQLRGAGLYQIKVYDSLNTERVDMMLAVVEPGQADLSRRFGHAKATLSAWNEQYYGWPIHDLLRAYLRSFYPRHAG